jgi:hypothetical protein
MLRQPAQRGATQFASAPEHDGLPVVPVHSDCWMWDRRQPSSWGGERARPWPSRVCTLQRMSRRSTPEAGESAAELLARRVLEQVLARRFEKVKPSNQHGRKTVDYRSVGDGPQHVAEVKEVVAPDFRDAAAAAPSARFTSARLTYQWSLILSTPVPSEALAAPPRFRDPAPAEVRDWEARGFQVMSAEERRREWLAEHPVRQPVPRLKNLGRRLAPHLLALERHGVMDTRGRWPWAEPNREVAEALRAIAAETCGAVCHGFPALAGRQGGVEVKRAWGYVRTGQPDTMVTRIERWFEEGLGGNLIASLATEPGAVRHAVLVFDATEPERRSAYEHRLSFCPSAAPILPDVIDVLWFILGPVACRFMPTEGWSSHRVPGVGDVPTPP